MSTNACRPDRRREQSQKLHGYALVVFAAFWGALIQIDMQAAVAAEAATATTSGTKWHPGHYVLYWSTKPNNPFKDVAKHKELRGAQVIYKWKALEPKKDQYNFSRIRAHLNTLKSKGKYLVVQLQMDEERSAPAYIKQEGGIYAGRPKLWTPEVRDRIKKLVAQLAIEFDREPHFEALTFPETSIGKWKRWKREPKRIREGWIEGFLDIGKHARTQFKQTNVIQYVNWGANLQSLVENLRASGVGMGGPDNEPNKNIKSYKFFTPNKGRMPLAIAVQPHQYRAKAAYTAKQLYDHAIEDLGVNYVFWARTEAFLSFSKQVVPHIVLEKGRINTACPENIKPCIQ